MVGLSIQPTPPPVSWAPSHPAAALLSPSYSSAPNCGILRPNFLSNSRLFHPTILFNLLKDPQPYACLPAWGSPSVILHPICLWAPSFSQPPGLLSSVPTSLFHKALAPLSMQLPQSLCAGSKFPPFPGAAILLTAFSVTGFLLVLHPLGPASDLPLPALPCLPSPTSTPGYSFLSPGPCTILIFISFRVLCCCCHCPQDSL